MEITERQREDNQAENEFIALTAIQAIEGPSTINVQYLKARRIVSFENNTMALVEVEESTAPKIRMNIKLLRRALDIIEEFQLRNSGQGDKLRGGCELSYGNGDEPLTIFLNVGRTHAIAIAPMEGFDTNKGKEPSP